MGQAGSKLASACATVVAHKLVTAGLLAFFLAVHGVIKINFTYNMVLLILIQTYLYFTVFWILVSVVLIPALTLLEWLMDATYKDSAKLWLEKGWNAAWEAAEEELDEKDAEIAELRKRLSGAGVDVFDDEHNMCPHA